jgi:hypothetical protein
MVPSSAIKARAKMHGIFVIWVVGLAARACDARVKIGLPSSVEVV